MKRVLVTGVAGFIGFHVALALKSRGDFCVGLDSFNSYYDVRLKETRASILRKENIEVVRADICHTDTLRLLMLKHHITHVVHLAAQAGVRHSLHSPQEYVSSNLQGFVSLLETLRYFPEIKLIYASSSSVYGLNRAIPFKEEDMTDQPTNLYGASKKANELIAHSYHHLYGLSVTALRYFTVYGPWGRPDMAYYRFTEKILKEEPIQVFNQGKMKRDFTDIEDIVRGTLAAIDLGASFEVFNLGGSHPIELLRLIEILEDGLKKKAMKEMLPMQPGEVVETFANIEKSQKLLGFSPSVPLEKGMHRFIEWFQEYHGLARSVRMQLA